MRIVRAFFKWLTAVVLHLSIIGFVAAVCFQVLLIDEQRVKQTIAASGVYEDFIPALIDQNAEQLKQNDSSIPFDDENIRSIIETTITPTVVKNAVERVIDAGYSWLTSDSTIPEFRIDLTPERDVLVDRLSTYAVLRLSDLPACRPEQLQQANVFTLACEPPGFYQDIVKSQVTNDLLASELLADPVFTAEDLPTTTDGQPVYERFAFLQTVYSIMRYVLPLSIAAFLLASIGYLLARTPKRPAFASYGRDVMMTGLTILLFTLFYAYVLPRFTSSFSLSSQTAGVSAAFESIMRRVDVLIINTTLQIAVFGLIIVIVERMSRTKDLYAQVAKKSGLATSLPVVKRASSAQRNTPPVQTSEADRKTKRKKTPGTRSRYRKIKL